MAAKATAAEERKDRGGTQGANARERQRRTANDQLHKASTRYDMERIPYVEKVLFLAHCSLVLKTQHILIAPSA